jgi:hypothetical protein
MEWKHPQLPSKETFKSQPTIRKKTGAYSFLALTNPSTGTLTGERETTIKNAHYGEVLTDRLRPAI